MRDRGKLVIRQTSAAGVIDENAGLSKSYRKDLNRSKENTYSLQVSMYGVIRVKIFEAFSRVQ